MRRGKQCEIEFEVKLKGGNHVRTVSEKIRKIMALRRHFGRELGKHAARNAAGRAARGFSR